MTPAAARVLVRRVGLDPDPPADADLLTRFARTADPAAFAALVARHGPMVLAACRRMLPAADADDAFQAVFLVLLRKAGAVRPAGAVGGWLHGVAVRTAQKARTAAARRRRREMTSLASPGSASPGSASPGRESGSSSLTPAEHAELRSVLDEELAKLPDPQRAAVVLCDLAGKTRAEAAADLGCPEGTVAARVHRGRRTLAERLTRRGFTAPAVVAAAAVPAELAAATAGFADGGAIPSAVRALADAVTRGLAAAPLAVAALAALATAAGVLWASAAPPAAPPAAPVEVKAGPVYQLGYTADGTKLVAVGGGKAVVRDSATGAVRFTTDAEFAQFGGDGTRLFVFAPDNRFRTLDAATGKELASADRGRPKAPAFTPGFVHETGGSWAAAAPDGSVRIESNGLYQFLTARPGGGPLPRLAGQDEMPPGPVTKTFTEVRTPGAFSPDGTRYAGVHAAMPDSPRPCVGVWKADGTRLGTVERARDVRGTPAAVAWAPDGKRLAVGFHDGARVYDADTLQELRTIEATAVTAVAWSADGKQLALGSSAAEPTVRLHDPVSGVLFRRIDGFAANLPVAALAFRPDGKELACGSGYLPNERSHGRPELAKAAVGLRLVALDPPPDVRAVPHHVSALQFAPNGRSYLVVAGGKVSVREAATGRQFWDAPATAARFTADGDDLVVLGEAVTRRNLLTTQEKTFPRGKNQYAWHVAAFSADGARYAAHEGLRVRLFDTATGFEPVRLTPEVGDPIAGSTLRAGGTDVLFSPDGKLIAGVGVLLSTTDISAAVWDAETGKRRFLFPPINTTGEYVPARAAAFSPDGKTFAVALEHRVHLFDVPTFAHRDQLDDTPGSGPVTALAFAPDGKSLAVGYRLPLHHGGDKQLTVGGHKTEVQLIDLATKKELRRFDGFEGVNHMGPTVLPVTALAFSPDGQTLLAGTGLPPLTVVAADKLPPGEVKRFVLAEPPGKVSVPPWRELGRLAPFPDRIHAVAFSPDGKHLAVGGRGGRMGPVQPTVTMFGAVRWDKRWAGGLVPAGTTGVAFSPDGKLLAATRDAATDLYDVTTGRPVVRNPPLPGGVATAISPDGKHLAVGTGRHTVVLPAAGGPAVLTRPASAQPLDANPPAPLAWAPDGTRLVLAFQDAADGKYGSDVYSLATGKTTRLTDHPATVHTAAWSQDGKHVATGCGKGDVILWDASTLKELRRTRIGGRSGEGEVRALAFAPDGQTLAAAVSLDEGKNAERVVILDAATGQRLGSDLQGFGNFTPVALAYAPDGRTLAVGLADFLPEIQLPPGGVDRPLGAVVLFTTDPLPKADPPAPAP